MTTLASIQLVKAQRSDSETIFPLLDQSECSYPSSSYASFESWDENVSIGRQLHNSSYRLWAYEGDTLAFLTCEIDTTKFDTLSLQMGMTDDAGNSVDATIKIYQSGSVLGEYRQVGAGDMIEYTIDLLNPNVGNPEDIAIELACETGNNYCYLYLVEAELTPTNYVPVN